jgi:hypothetical protein
LTIEAPALATSKVGVASWSQSVTIMPLLSRARSHRQAMESAVSPRYKIGGRHVVPACEAR